MKESQIGLAAAAPVSDLQREANSSEPTHTPVINSGGSLEGRSLYVYFYTSNKL